MSGNKRAGDSGLSEEQALRKEGDDIISEVFRTEELTRDTERRLEEIAYRTGTIFDYNEETGWLAWGDDDIHAERRMSRGVAIGVLDDLYWKTFGGVVRSTAAVKSAQRALDKVRDWIHEPERNGGGWTVTIHMRKRGDASLIKSAHAYNETAEANANALNEVIITSNGDLRMDATAAAKFFTYLAKGPLKDDLRYWRD